MYLGMGYEGGCSFEGEIYNLFLFYGIAALG